MTLVYNPAIRQAMPAHGTSERKRIIPTNNSEGRWRRFAYKEFAGDIMWLKDKSLADLDSLSAPGCAGKGDYENLESALGSFREIMTQLRK